MFVLFRKRRARKMARDWLRQARHARLWREDLAAPAHLEALDRAVGRLRAALGERPAAPAEIETACESVAAAVRALIPKRSPAWLRENFEIALVAVVVAMAFRAYFIQPFKIPTGSMQPTLYGIHYKPQTSPGNFDRFPLKYARWLLFGESYSEHPAAVGGIAGDVYLREDDSTSVYVNIGGRMHALPRALMGAFRFRPGERVARGQVLASGTRTLGDHIFVNKVRWNFVPPRRGDVMVFTTRGIPQIDQDTHYIKRMVGMPDESIGIDPPFLLVNGEKCRDDGIIGLISMQTGGYAGYQVTGAESGDPRFVLNDSRDRLRLGPDEYAAFGDNTGSSLDSRYWGAVPQNNLVGPAFWVYWPFSARWGRIR